MTSTDLLLNPSPAAFWLGQYPGGAGSACLPRAGAVVGVGAVVGWEDGDKQGSSPPSSVS